MGMEEAVVFTGFVPDEELSQYYAACDAFILASKFETQGLVVLEAMATGKPVACIDYRATAEIVNDGEDGYLFQDDLDSCVTSLERALDSPDSLRKKARGTAERYSMTGMVEKLVGIYEFAIEQKRERSGVPRVGRGVGR